MPDIIHQFYEEIALGGGAISLERVRLLAGHLTERLDNAKQALRLCGYRIVIVKQVEEDERGLPDTPTVFRVRCELHCVEDWSEADRAEADGWRLAAAPDRSNVVVIQHPPQNWYILPRRYRRADLGLAESRDTAAATA